MRSSTLGLLWLALLAVPLHAAEPAQPRELIYGAELMSGPERERYRRSMARAGSPEKQEQVRAQHRERLRERARTRGVTLDEASGVVRQERK